MLPRQMRQRAWQRNDITARPIGGPFHFNLAVKIRCFNRRARHKTQDSVNLYHCQIELRPEARALSFAAAVAAWMDHLRSKGLVRDWRLMRRKLGLASGAHSDFLLEVELPGFGALDTAFAGLADSDEEALRRYDQMHGMIARADVGLYRPWPDPAQRERIALI